MQIDCQGDVEGWYKIKKVDQPVHLFYLCISQVYYGISCTEPFKFTFPVCRVPVIE